MKTFDYIIKDTQGIHVRPAGLLAKEAKKFTSTITITKKDKTNNITKLMAVMAMGVKTGEKVTITVEGQDEEEAVQAIKKFFENNL